MIKTTLSTEKINTLVDTLCEKITIQSLNWGLNRAKHYYVNWRFSPVLNNLTLGGYRLFRAVKVLCRPLENLHNNEDPQQALLKILEAGGGTGINSIKWSILYYLLQYPTPLHDVSDQESDFIIQVAINKLKKIVLEKEIDNIFLNKDDKISLEKKVMAILKKYIQERMTMISWFNEPVEVTEAKDLMNKINEYFGINAEGDGQVLTQMHIGQGPIIGLKEILSSTVRDEMLSTICNRCVQHLDDQLKTFNINNKRCDI